MILSQYKETCEVLIDYPTIRGEDIKDYVWKSIRNLLHENIDVYSRSLIAEFPVDGVKFTSNIQSHCANMTSADKRRYDRICQKVTRKGGESAMNYIKIIQNTQALSVSVGNRYSEDQLMHVFLDNFHQDGKYIAHKSIHQAKFRREEKFTDQKYLSITSLQTDYVNLDIRSGSVRNNERANCFQKKCTFCGGDNNSTEKFFKRILKDKGKACAAGGSDRQRTERTPRKYFRCVSVDLIAKFLKPP